MHLHHLFQSPSPCVVAVGNFDGVHPGHKAVLQTAVSVAKTLKVTPAALTFAPNPREFFFPATRPHNLMSLREKVEAMRALGIEAITIARFSEDFSCLGAEAFAKDLLVKRLKAKHVVTGENFVFGHKRGGNAALLHNWLDESSVNYTSVRSVQDSVGITSSTRIREALAHGELAIVRDLLGQDFSISGRVIHGDKRGRTIGFPTLNLSLGKRFRPMFGVYAVDIVVQDKQYKGIANIGIKPSFGGKVPLLEAHSFEPLPELYGKRIRVVLKHFIRPEKTFANVQDLVDQIKQDIEKARVS